MNSDRWRVKLQGLLYRGPEGIPVDRLRHALLKDANVDDVVRQADELAWGADAVVRGLSAEPVAEILHPLSGSRLDLSVSSSALQIDDFEHALLSLSCSAGGPQELFSRLWQAFPDGIVPGAGLLPVDARLPARPWRLHATLTSALAACLFGGDQPAFLTFTIASAQDFIATARRTQDYWMGSFILSWLVWKSLQPIVENFGPDCVLMPSLRWHPLMTPGPGDAQPSRPTAGNLANIWTAVVPGRCAESIASECAQCATKAWGEIVRAVREKLTQALKKVSPGTAGGSDPSVWEEAWDRVVAGASDVVGSGIYWAAVPWRTNLPVEQFQADYRTYGDPPPYLSPRADGLSMAFFEHMSLAARAVTARKHLRDFPQVREDGWRCTLCGLRQALATKWPGPPPKDLWKDLSKHEDAGIKLKGRIRRNEQLCAACATKRLAWEHYFRGDHHLFPSTSTIAAAAFLKSLITVITDHILRQKIEEYCTRVEELRKKIKEYCTRVEELREKLDVPRRPESPLPALEGFSNDPVARDLLELGGDWLYRESYEPEKLAWEEGLELQEVRSCEALAQARKALDELLESAAKAGIKPARPSDYFAVLRMDGDGLGDWLGGAKALQLRERVPNSLKDDVRGRGDLPASPVHVLAVAEALNTFTTNRAPAIVEQEHLGVLVFAGGDELLALAPTEDALRMASQLRGAFCAEHVDTRLAMGGNASITGAVVVAHREAPLSEAIEQATTLVDRAKRYATTSALRGDLLAVAIARRGGELQEAFLSWEVGGRDTAGVLLGLAEALREEKVAMGFPSRLAMVLDQLGTAEPVKAVVTHLLARHAGRGTLADFPEFASGLVAAVAARNPQAGGLSALRGFCLAARFLAREG